MINCGKVVAGTASNVVPALAVIEAEVRSEDEAEVDRLSGELEMLVRGLGSAFGVETTVVTTGLAPTSRATPDLAALVPETSGGAMRADSWRHLPLIRMTNVSLEPGDWTFDDLVADTEEGIYMQTNRSWSIDDKRLNFQFGTELAREIKSGKLGDLVKNATYTGITPRFWGSCDAIVNRDGWVVWGTPNCGKGQPEQVAHTGHGASASRFRNVRVGVMQ